MNATRSRLSLVCASVALAALLGCSRSKAVTFASPEDAVNALNTAVSRGKLDAVSAIFGRDAKALIDSSDPETARRNRQVFTVAMSEGWRLSDNANGSKTLVVGNEQWPFPVPIAKAGNRWGFDTAAGAEEVIDRRIGHNELAAIGLARTYVVAQRRYAQDGHDGHPAGRYATVFASDTGKHNGLYWASAAGEQRSPLGDLVAEAALDRRARMPNRQVTPLYGYYFRILTTQGPAASGGAMDYIVGGEMMRGFALIAWPARYDVTGVMTFVVNQSGIVYQRDLGRDTEALVQKMMLYDPDGSWQPVTD